jgi:hypothetical protein
VYAVRDGIDYPARLATCGVISDKKKDYRDENNITLTIYDAVGRVVKDFVVLIFSLP